MWSGIWNHQQQSDNPCCKETGPGTFPIGNINGLEMEDLEVNQRGDVFGDYSPEELGLAPVEDNEENLTHNGDSDDDDEDIIDEGVDNEGVDNEGGYEISLEPNRPQNPSFSNVDDVDNSNGITQWASWLQGRAEVELKNKPYSVKFSKGKAGAVFMNHEHIHGNTAYISQISNPENTFSLFSSKIKWEIAHWAKTWGPSSTAFTELISIEGVSGITIYVPFEANFPCEKVHEWLGLSFKNTTELNKIIDETLPGRPCFKWHELIIGNEVCEVYFWDVIECIKALFNDPIIISTNKTQLTTFWNKSAYPLYLTIRNILKEIHQKPSNHAYILLAYPPTTWLEIVSNRATRCCQLAKLYHACMVHILEPLKVAGTTGIFMASGDGLVCWIHPLHTCFSGDYPEHV